MYFIKAGILIKTTNTIFLFSRQKSKRMAKGQVTNARDVQFVVDNSMLTDLCTVYAVFTYSYTLRSYSFPPGHLHLIGENKIFGAAIRHCVEHGGHLAMITPVELQRTAVTANVIRLVPRYIAITHMIIYYIYTLKSNLDRLIPIHSVYTTSLNYDTMSKCLQSLNHLDNICLYIYIYIQIKSWQVNTYTLAANVMESQTRWLHGFIFGQDFEVIRNLSYNSCSREYFYICRQQINVRKCRTNANCVIKLMAIRWKGVESGQQCTAP